MSLIKIQKNIKTEQKANKTNLQLFFILNYIALLLKIIQSPYIYFFNKALLAFIIIRKKKKTTVITNYSILLVDLLVDFS